MINNVLITKYDLLITILSYSIRQVGLMLIVSLFVAYISSSIPVRKISRKRPIDAIRDK